VPADRSAGYVIPEMRHNERFCKCEFRAFSAWRKILPVRPAAKPPGFSDLA
jgi:hypothetical protein